MYRCKTWKANDRLCVLVPLSSIPAKTTHRCTQQAYIVPVRRRGVRGRCWLGFTLPLHRPIEWRITSQRSLSLSFHWPSAHVLHAFSCYHCLHTVKGCTMKYYTLKYLNFGIFQDTFFEIFREIFNFHYKVTLTFKNMIKVYEVSRKYNNRYLPLTCLLTLLQWTV